MRILAIETSCDETAISILEAEGDATNASFMVRGNALYSQATKHASFGGVYPSLAKREHAANLVPLLNQTLRESRLARDTTTTVDTATMHTLTVLLAREHDLLRTLHTYTCSIERPAIDALAVTQGPGLEPALWVGVNFARALSLLWNVPIYAVNHLEGHLVASAVNQDAVHASRYRMTESIRFPALGLILSGGHTEFIYATAWGAYQIVGQTRDDSIGEAFDKVARLLGIPYPGGPGLSRLADKGRPALHTRQVPVGPRTQPLPRPMLRSGDLDFSFSGLKTAVLYQTRELGELQDETKNRIAADFEDAVTEVILQKTTDALDRYPAHTFILGGGVSANIYIRSRLANLFAKKQEVTLRLPASGLSTDNAVMIGMAGYLMHVRGARTYQGTDDLRASSTLSVAS